MLKLSSFFILLLLFTCKSNHESKVAEKHFQPDEKIEVKNTIVDTLAILNFKKNIDVINPVEFDYDEELSTEGTGLMLYLSDTVDIANFTSYGEMGKTESLLFFKNDTLFYIEENIYHYTSPFYMEDSKIERVERSKILLQELDEILLKMKSFAQQKIDSIKITKQ